MGQPPAVRELFQYAVMMLMIENYKAEIKWRTVNQREWVTVRTVAGELFNIVKPIVDDGRQMAATPPVCLHS